MQNTKSSGSNYSSSHSCEWLFIHTVVECPPIYSPLLPEVTKVLIVKKEEEKQSFINMDHGKCQDWKINVWYGILSFEKHQWECNVAFKSSVLGNLPFCYTLNIWWFASAKLLGLKIKNKKLQMKFILLAVFFLRWWWSFLVDNE